MSKFQIGRVLFDTDLPSVSCRSKAAAERALRGFGFKRDHARQLLRMLADHPRNHMIVRPSPASRPLEIFIQEF